MCVEKYIANTRRKDLERCLEERFHWLSSEKWDLVIEKAMPIFEKRLLESKELQKAYRNAAEFAVNNPPLIEAGA